MGDLSRYRRHAARALADHAHAVRTVAAEEAGLSAARTAHADAAEGRRIVQEVAATVQANVHAQISRVVSTCLETVFDRPYEFRVLFEQKRGKTEARLVFTRDGREYDPTTETGGGVVDVTAFALRLGAVVMHRPAVRRVMFLDESFRMLSRNYAPRVRSLLDTLASEMAFQFVQITHSPALVTGTVVEIE